MAAWRLDHRAAFPSLCGLTLVVQATYTYHVLAAALPSHGALRFAHACLPRAPTFMLSPRAVAAYVSIIQVTSGALLIIATATSCARVAQYAALAGCGAVAYMLLLEASIYQNHLYLLVNVLLCIGVTPPGPMRHALLRFSTALPYVYGALSKLTSPDWMYRHQPARRWCEAELLPIASTLMSSAWLRSPRYAPTCASLLSIGGLLIDLVAVPLLALPLLQRRHAGALTMAMARRGRWLGAALAAAFHVCNHALFHIGIFPWLMLAALPLWWCGVDEHSPPQDAAKAVTATLVNAFNASNAPNAKNAPTGTTNVAMRRRPPTIRTAPATKHVAARRARSPPRTSKRPPSPPARARPPPPPRLPMPSSCADAPCARRWFCCAYVAFHLLMPLRRFAYVPWSDPTWTQEGYLGAWLMKRHQTDGIVIVIFEKRTSHEIMTLDPSPDGVDAPAAERLLVAPQLDPLLTRHQRRFVNVRPAAMEQYIYDRARILANATSGEAEITARVLSCLTHNARPPQPLYDSGVDVLRRRVDVRARTCLGTRSGIGEWLVPLAPLREGAPTLTLAPECDELLEAPRETLRTIEGGFRRLYGSDVAETWAAGGARAEAAAWYWRSLSTVDRAVDAHMQHGSRKRN